MKKVLLISYLCQGYIILIGIVLMPFYLQYMGAESFGLFGFYLALQVWVQLFDLGFSPAISREMSLFRAGTQGITQLLEKLKSLELFFGMISLAIIFSSTYLGSYLATYWFQFEKLSLEDVQNCLTMMIIASIFRWGTGLYRSSLTGLEQQIWVSGVGVLFATLKFGIAFLILVYESSYILVFFSYQLLVNGLEFFCYRWKLYRKLPGILSISPQWSTMKKMFPMAGSMGLLSAMWICVTQLDKLILSSTLSLSDYGYFTLAIALAGGLLMLLPPLTQVLQPRMTILKEQGEIKLLKNIYHTASQLNVAIFFALGGGIAFFSEPILFIWTGNLMSAQETAPILFWYGLANAMIGILVMPFLLQFAYGYLRLHLIGNFVLVIILLPTIFLVSKTYGAVGAGVTLLCLRFLYLILWVPIVHHKLMPGITVQWLKDDVISVVCITIGVLMLSHYLMPDMLNKIAMISYVLCSIVFAFIAGILAGSCSRKLLMQRLL